MFKVLFAKQKKLPWKPKKDRGAKPCLSRFPRELRVRCFARDAQSYSTERSAPIPDSNPASRTGRVLSHLSIQLLLYGVNTNFATLIISLPLLRAYFRSFMGRNQFKKVRSRPLKKSEAEEVRQGKGVPFRRALHTFGTPCTLRCTPFFIEVCRQFFLFSLVYEPFPMLSRRPARHAHLFSNDLYIHEGIYIFSYIRLIKWCA